jgi:hypothetical protein
MTLYGIALYLHILAAVGIIGGSCLEQYIHTRMHRARTLDTLKEWLGAGRTISKLMPIFALSLLIFGTYMTFARWGWQQPWILTSLGLLIAISIASPLLLAPNMRAIGKAAFSGASLSDIAPLLADPVSNIAGGVFTVESLAIALLMVMKPSLMPTLIIVVVAAVIGVFVGWPKAQAHAAAPESVGVETSAGRAH